MKKKVLAIVLASALVLSLGLVLAGPTAAADYVLYGTIGGKYLVTVDPTTGDASEVAMLSGPVDSVNPIAFDWNSGKLYGLARAGGNHRPWLAEIDICTGEVTVVGQITLPGRTVYFAEGLAVDPSGTIYVSMSINGDFSPGSDYYSETLATVNPSTAVATQIGTISPTVQTEADGLEFVLTTLYATDDPGRGPTNIYTINTSTAAATFKGTLSSPRFNNVNDMAYNPVSNKLYGFDPGAYTNGHPRYLCEISQPGTATATAIGITHTSSEFDGGLMSGLAWAPECEEEVEVNVDIKPTSCPNPLNFKSKGVLPVAILGTDEFDVSEIDPATVELEGVSPLRWAIEDVATPFDGVPSDCDDCSTPGPDGYQDLTLKFSTQAVVAALGDVEDGDCVILTLTGNLKEDFGGAAIQGEDVVKIIKKGR